MLTSAKKICWQVLQICRGKEIFWQSPNPLKSIRERRSHWKQCEPLPSAWYQDHWMHIKRSKNCCKEEIRIPAPANTHASRNQPALLEGGIVRNFLPRPSRQTPTSTGWEVQHWPQQRSGHDDMPSTKANQGGKGGTMGHSEERIQEKNRMTRDQLAGHSQGGRRN